MAKNISLLGADYPDVPAVQLPQTGGGTATFYDINVIDDLNSDSSTDALSAKQGKVLNTKIENNSYSQFSVLYNRGTILNGGYVRIGKKVFISVVFQSNATASNIPGILGTNDFTSDIHMTALNCVDITEYSSNTITNIPCVFESQGNNRIMLQNIVSGHTYTISGVVNIQ